MPVYGLPSALESSLNSLAHSRPPSSWRVSSNGNDVTVVLRWTQCLSPASDQTVHYNIDHDPKDRLRHSSFSWRHPFSQESDPLTLTPADSALDGRVSRISTKFDSDFQPVKLRSIDTSRRRPLRTTPVPMFISSSSALEKPSGNSEPCPMTVYGERSVTVGSEQREGGLSTKNGGAPSALRDTPSPPESCKDLEIREGIRTYLSRKSREASAEEEVILDERSGLIVRNSEADCGNRSHSVANDHVPSNARNVFKDSRSLSQLSSRPNSSIELLSLDLESPGEILDECLNDDDTMVTPARNEGQCSGMSASTIRSPASQNVVVATLQTKDLDGAYSSPANMFMVSEDDLQPCDLEIVCSLDSEGGDEGNSPGKHSTSDWENSVELNESGDSESTGSSFGSVNDGL